MFNTKITLDPIKNNIRNMVAQGTVVEGQYQAQGGLFLAGQMRGAPLTVVDGPLLVYEQAVLLGRAVVHGDVYVLGTVGSSEEGDGDLDLIVYGTLHVASTGRTFGTIACFDLNTYVGSSLNSRIRTLPPEPSQAEQPASVAPEPGPLHAQGSAAGA